jgi:hypothetical protein
MPDINSSKITASKLGFFDLWPKDRKRIYQFALMTHNNSPIIVRETGLHAPGHDPLVISSRPLSAQLLRTCHQVLKEARHILYTENSFTLHLRNRVPFPKEIPIEITRGNLRTLKSIIISIDSLRTLGHDLHLFVICFPSLQMLGIRGKLVTMTESDRNLNAYDTVAEQCRRESVVRLISAFGGLEVFHGFLLQHSNLDLDYNFGIGADIIMAATGEVIHVEPQVRSVNYRDNKLLTGRAAVAHGYA